MHSSKLHSPELHGSATVAEKTLAREKTGAHYTTGASTPGDPGMSPHRIPPPSLAAVLMALTYNVDGVADTSDAISYTVRGA